MREGDEYVVTGQKIWSTRAHVADYCELLVRTDPDAPKHKGITWLILDMHQPGVEVRPMRTIDGESHFCEVFLDGARVPVTNRVGEENDGWRVTNVTLRFERGTAFAQHIITLRSQLRRLVALARQRRAGAGADAGTAWDDPGLRRQVGRLDARVDALWRMTQRCVTEAEATGVPSPLGSAVKLGYSELGQEIAQLGMRLLGRRALGAGGPDTEEARIGARLPVVVPVHDRRGHLADPAQPGRRADPRHAEGPLTERWDFGVEPLPQTATAAALLRG